MDWFTAFIENSKNLPLIAQASVLMAVTWGRCEGDVLTVADAASRDAQRVWVPGQFEEGLAMAVSAGWLAPLEHLADGSLRTTLTIPEGV
jgi:hypothetical protein